MLRADQAALKLAPMEGFVDAAMRELVGATGAFSFAVSEFIRVTDQVIPAKVFHRVVPELRNGAKTSSGMPVQVQLLGGDSEVVAQSALVAITQGATAIDLNFGCPAPTVNRHDGGATLLKHPARIREVVAAVREAVPVDVPVSVKLRLGWDMADDIHENAAKAVEGGADWLTIHARTRMQGYKPPVRWDLVGEVRRVVGVPVVVNGDIWTVDDFRRCRAESGCSHVMLGRGALADPCLPIRVAEELGLRTISVPTNVDWPDLLHRFVAISNAFPISTPKGTLARLKQWLALAHSRGSFKGFAAVKLARTVEEVLDAVDQMNAGQLVL